MNRENLAMKLAVMVLAGMMVASPAAWAEKKGKASSGPSEQETVEFINGLLACDVSHELVQRNERTLSSWGKQRSTLSGDSIGVLIENATGAHVSEAAVIGVAKHTSISIPWGQLETAKSPNDPNVELRCNPKYADCIGSERKEVSAVGTSSGRGGRCIYDPANCLDVAKAALSSVQPTQKNESSWTINFCSAEDAVRGAKAINHLIELHGGKKSLF